jgi:hypothetical protein
MKQVFQVMSSQLEKIDCPKVEGGSERLKRWEKVVQRFRSSGKGVHFHFSFGVSRACYVTVSDSCVAPS